MFPLLARNWFRFVVFLVHVSEKSSHFALSSVIALGPDVICNRIVGLYPRQRHICRERPDSVISIYEGIQKGKGECHRQFQRTRWNCTTLPSLEAQFFPDMPKATRESAFLRAITSAGVTHAITQACSRGNLTDCSCDRSKDTALRDDGWQWGGCSADIRYGLQFSELFMDASHMPDNAKGLMNIHNNEVGRRVLSENMERECKCHGVSGSCTTQTCWMTLPQFRTVGDILKRKYETAYQVEQVGRRANARKIILKIKKTNKKPRLSHLVYLEESPTFCEYDAEAGSLGTVGRRCNHTSTATDHCELMCCGRGYNTHQYTRTWQCNCKFLWCCSVRCNTCSENTEEYTCK
ncbi:protein Wnt-7b-like isoform X1 [Apostichopus japonicus]|uniref:protein Wnt-7b-like isoform X1 n=1 Tax=Stichopus japonicus TaxID=307972 RepID=UPI003AB8EE78